MIAPTAAGTSYVDRAGCADRDGDGYSNAGDPFPDDSTQWSDRDGDNRGDNQMATIQMRSPTTPVSGKTAMAMATAITVLETTAMISPANQRNGVTKTTTATVTTLKARTPMSVRLNTVNRKNLSRGCPDSDL